VFKVREVDFGGDVLGSGQFEKASIDEDVYGFAVWYGSGSKGNPVCGVGKPGSSVSHSTHSVAVVSKRKLLLQSTSL